MAAGRRWQHGADGGRARVATRARGADTGASSGAVRVKARARVAARHGAARVAALAKRGAGEALGRPTASRQRRVCIYKIFCIYKPSERTPPQALAPQALAPQALAVMEST